MTENLWSKPTWWDAEAARIMALWELANANEGWFAQQYAADAYNALEWLMAMRP